MGQIQFDHQCYIDGEKFEQDSVVDESKLPPDWLKGALKAKFVSRVPDAVNVQAEGNSSGGAPTGSGSDGTPATGATVAGQHEVVIPPEVKAAMDAATKM